MISHNVFLVLALAICAALAVDIKSLQEQKCLKPSPKQVDMDVDWVSKVSVWHMTAASQLHAYRTAAAVAGVKETDVTPDDLYYKSCTRFVWGAETTVTGYGNKQIDIDMKPAADGSGFSFTYASLGLDGKATVVLTDNKTFMVHYVCWAGENQATYAVISPEPVLSSKAKKMVLKKIKELGFSTKLFTNLRFESCDAANEADANSKDEL